jgi:hypothetical protein
MLLSHSVPIGNPISLFLKIANKKLMPVNLLIMNTIFSKPKRLPLGKNLSIYT